MRVLVVEDEVLIAMAMRLHLEAEGHDVFGPAATAAEAKQLLREEHFDLALVDLHLAQGSSGLDVAAAMKERGIPCLFVTAFADRIANDPTLSLGCLRKPYPAFALIASVRAVQALLSGQEPAIPEGLVLFGHHQRNPRS